MIIKLTQGYFVEPDEMQYILKQRYTCKAKDGSEKEAVRNVSYHLTLEQAIEKYLKMLETSLQPDKAVTLREYVKMYTQATKAAVRAIKQATEGKE